MVRVTIDGMTMVPDPTLSLSTFVDLEDPHMASLEEFKLTAANGGTLCFVIRSPQDVYIFPAQSVVIIRAYHPLEHNLTPFGIDRLRLSHEADVVLQLTTAETNELRKTSRDSVMYHADVVVDDPDKITKILWDLNMYSKDNKIYTSDRSFTRLDPEALFLGSLKAEGVRLLVGPGSLLEVVFTPVASSATVRETKRVLLIDIRSVQIRGTGTDNTVCIKFTERGFATSVYLDLLNALTGSFSTNMRSLVLQGLPPLQFQYLSHLLRLFVDVDFSANSLSLADLSSYGLYFTEEMKLATVMEIVFNDSQNVTYFYPGQSVQFKCLTLYGYDENGEERKITKSVTMNATSAQSQFTHCFEQQGVMRPFAYAAATTLLLDPPFLGIVNEELVTSHDAQILEWLQQKRVRMAQTSQEGEGNGEDSPVTTHKRAGPDGIADTDEAPAKKARGEDTDVMLTNPSTLSPNVATTSTMQYTAEERSDTATETNADERRKGKVLRMTRAIASRVHRVTTFFSDRSKKEENAESALDDEEEWSSTFVRSSNRQTSDGSATGRMRRSIRASLRHLPSRLRGKKSEQDKENTLVSAVGAKLEEDDQPSTSTVIQTDSQ